MPALTSLIVGNVARTDVTFTPADEMVTVSAADVSCRVIDPDGTITAVTVQEGADDNQFYGTHTIGDTARTGLWTFRWECSNPKTSVEIGFGVSSSAFGEDA